MSDYDEQMEEMAREQMRRCGRRKGDRRRGDRRRVNWEAWLFGALLVSCVALLG